MTLHFYIQKVGDLKDKSALYNIVLIMPLLVSKKNNAKSKGYILASIMHFILNRNYCSESKAWHKN